MNKELYISLIARQLSSELNTSQLQNLNSWLSKSKDNANLLNEFKQTWAATASYKQNIAIDVDSAFSSFSKKFNIPAPSAVEIAPQKTSNLKRNSIIALLLLMLFSLGVLYTSLTSDNITNTKMEALTTYIGNAEITLSPNSSIKESTTNTLLSTTVDELNTILNSKNTSSDGAYFVSHNVNATDLSDNLSIESLSGQAFIDLNDNKDFKFFGLKGGQSVAAKDASFNIQNYQDDNMTVVDVQAGKVLFFDDKGDAFVINAGQRAIFDDKTGKMVKAENPAINPFKWHKGILVFDNTPLDEAFLLLERFYGVSIDIDTDSDLSDKNFTATFPISSNLNDCLQLINTSFEMDIEKMDERSIKISNIKGE